MAYVPLTTVNDGDTTLTAWGNQVKDNFAAGVPDIFTTKGDIAIASGVDAAGRLGVGSNFQIAHAMSSATLGIEYSRGVWVKATRVSAQSIPNDSLTKVQIDTASGDDDLYSMFDGTNYRLTIPVSFPSSRYYIVVATGFFANHSTDGTLRFFEIQKNGGGIAGQTCQQLSDNALGTNISLVSPPVVLDPSSYVELHVRQNSGGNLDLSSVTFGLFMVR